MDSLRLEDIYDYLLSGKAVLQVQNETSSIPSSDSEKINVFDFDYNRNSPLRMKDMFVTFDYNQITIKWVTLGDFSDISGMKAEFERWFDQFKILDADNTVYLKVDVCTRDGFGNTSFTIKRKDEANVI